MNIDVTKNCLCWPWKSFICSISPRRVGWNEKIWCMVNNNGRAYSIHGIWCLFALTNNLVLRRWKKKASQTNKGKQIRIDNLVQKLFIKPMSSIDFQIYYCYTLTRYWQYVLPSTTEILRVYRTRAYKPHLVCKYGIIGVYNQFTILTYYQYLSVCRDMSLKGFFSVHLKIYSCVMPLLYWVRFHRIRIVIVDLESIMPFVFRKTNQKLANSFLVAQFESNWVGRSIYQNILVLISITLEKI